MQIITNNKLQNNSMNFSTLQNNNNTDCLTLIKNYSSNFIKINEFNDLLKQNYIQEYKKDLLEENYIQEYEKKDLRKLIINKKFIKNNNFTNPMNYFMRTIDKNNKKKCPTVKFKISNNKIYSDNNNIITDFNKIIISKSDKN